MPSKVPRISGPKVISAFKKDGWYVARIKGSHHILKKEGERNLLTIPVHSGETVGTGLLASQIKQAGLTVEEFEALL